MKFRTEIEAVKSTYRIRHGEPVLMLGSCFTDNIGARLDIDGFDVCHNPLGPLYNPVSIAACIGRALKKYRYSGADLTEGPNGYHCLDYASRYSGSDPEAIVSHVNDDFSAVAERLGRPGANTLIITFGSAFVFERHGEVVGNCHKFPASEFCRRLLSVSEITELWTSLIASLPDNIHIIFTVSPIRHLADGLHGNTISKSTLLLAVEQICRSHAGRAEYFPSYEIMVDDLRDYRFYAADMKHPSDVAVDYIYDFFLNTYTTVQTQESAAENRRRYRAGQHRQIL